MRHTFDERSPKPHAVNFEKLLRKIVWETQAHHSMIVLSSFATVAHEGLTVTYAKNPGLFNELYRYRYPLTPGELAEGFDYYNRILAEVAAEFRTPYVDIAGTFPRDIRYFPADLVHFTPEGNQRLAGEFARFLAHRVLPQVMLRGQR